MVVLLKIHLHNCILLSLLLKLHRIPLHAPTYKTQVLGSRGKPRWNLNLTFKLYIHWTQGLLYNEWPYLMLLLKWHSPEVGNFPYPQDKSRWRWKGYRLSYTGPINTDRFLNLNLSGNLRLSRPGRHNGMIGYLILGVTLARWQHELFCQTPVKMLLGRYFLGITNISIHRLWIKLISPHNVCGTHQGLKRKVRFSKEAAILSPGCLTQNCSINFSLGLQPHLPVLEISDLPAPRIR